MGLPENPAKFKEQNKRITRRMKKVRQINRTGKKTKQNQKKTINTISCQKKHKPTDIQVCGHPINIVDGKKKR